MTTTKIIDGDGNPKLLQDPPAPGRAAAAASVPSVWSTEDLAQITTLNASIVTLNASIAALNTSIGVPSSAAWSGTGDASLISISKTDALAGMDTSSVAVNSWSNLVEVPVALDTSTAYAAGDILVDTFLIANAARVNDECVILNSITINDDNDISVNSAGMDLTIYILDANNSLGTINVPPSITDANARKIKGIIRILPTDWVDVGASKHVMKTGLGIALRPVSGSRSLYAAVVTGTAVSTAIAQSMQMDFGFI